MQPSGGWTLKDGGDAWSLQRCSLQEVEHCMVFLERFSLEGLLAVIPFGKSGNIEGISSGELVKSPDSSIGPNWETSVGDIRVGQDKASLCVFKLTRNLMGFCLF